MINSLAEIASSHALHFPLVMAYLDPGSGSFIIQVVIATLLGFTVLIRIYWKRLKALFSRASKNGQEDEAPKDE